MLDHGAANNVFEGGLRGLCTLAGGGGGLGNEGLQDGLLVEGSVSGRGKGV